MCTPIDPDTVSPMSALQNALCEIVSAESALNMEPDPLTDTGDPNSRGYLSEVDGWAKHAMEHLHAAFALVGKAASAQQSLKDQVFRLVLQLREANLEPKVRTWLDEDDTLPELK